MAAVWIKGEGDTEALTRLFLDVLDGAIKVEPEPDDAPGVLHATFADLFRT